MAECRSARLAVHLFVSYVWWRLFQSSYSTTDILTYATYVDAKSLGWRSTINGRLTVNSSQPTILWPYITANALAVSPADWWWPRAPSPASRPRVSESTTGLRTTAAGQTGADRAGIVKRPGSVVVMRLISRRSPAVLPLQTAGGPRASRLEQSPQASLKPARAPVGDWYCKWAQLRKALPVRASSMLLDTRLVSATTCPSLPAVQRPVKPMKLFHPHWDSSSSIKFLLTHNYLSIIRLDWCCKFSPSWIWGREGKKWIR